MANYRIWVLDVVGDEDGGYSVNDRSELRKSFPIKGDATDAGIIKALVDGGILSPKANTKNIELSGDDMVIYVDESKDGYPLLQLEKLGDNPLTRKEVARRIRNAEKVAGMSKRDYADGYIAATVDTIWAHGPKNVPINKVSYHLRRRLKNPPGFKNVAEYKKFVEYSLIPALKADGHIAVAEAMERLLLAIKARRFDAALVAHLKNTIVPGLYKTELGFMGADVHQGIKFLYEETDGGKRVGHNKNPLYLGSGKIRPSKAFQFFIVRHTPEKKIVREFRAGSSDAAIKIFNGFISEHSGEYSLVFKNENNGKEFMLTHNRYKRFNPLSAAERKDILKVAAEHDRDALEHRSVELRKFDAGTASGLREAVAIASARRHKAQDTGHRRNPHGGSLYFALKNAGIPLDSHESDLYALYTPKSEELFKDFGYPIKTFISQIDGKRWLEAPFAHTPWWAKRIGKK